jgi:hypothetical protein
MFSSRKQRHADAEVQLESITVDFDRILECCPHTGREEFRAWRQRHLVRDADELVAAHPRHVAALRGFLKTARGFAQYGISGPARTTPSDCHPRRWSSAIFATGARRFGRGRPMQRWAINVCMNRMRIDLSCTVSESENIVAPGRR